MDFEVVFDDESAPIDQKQVAALQNLTQMDLKIARLKLHFSNRVRPSKNKLDTESGAFAQPFRVSSHKTDVPSNGLEIGSTLLFLEEAEQPFFMFTSECEDTESEVNGKAGPEKRVFVPVASQALTEVVEPTECCTCKELRETVAALQEIVGRLTQQNRLLDRSAKTYQEQLYQANATIRRLQRRQNSSSERENSDGWVNRFMSLLASNEASRAYESHSSQRLIAEKAVQCVDDPVKSELQLMLDAPATPRKEQSRHSPSKSPGSIRRGSFWGTYGKEKKPEEDCLLRPQIIQKWANSFRSGSTSPMSRTFTAEDKVTKPKSQAEERTRKRILNLMKEKEVLRMLKLNQGNK